MNNSNKQHEELLSIQKLYVKLFFCRETQKNFRENPKAVLREYKIELSKLSIFPDLNQERFAVESHGRQFMIAKELLGRYTRFFKLVTQANSEKELTVPRILGLKIFQDFLSSDYFFLPKFSVVHPYGIGKGYENVSKFFLWVSRHIKTDPDFETALKTDFGIYLIQQARHASDPFYLQLKRGIFFSVRQRDSKKRTFILITPQCKVVKIENVDEDYFQRKEITNLDEIQSCDPN